MAKTGSNSARYQTGARTLFCLLVLAVWPVSTLADDTYESNWLSGDFFPRLQFLHRDQKYIIYGQINEALLSYGDGVSRETYAPVGNSNSSSRVGISITRLRNRGWQEEFNFEYEFTPYISARVNKENRGDRNFGLDGANVRKFEAIFTSQSRGTFWVGQGSMASDATSEMDLSGTTVAAYSAVNSIAGGQIFQPRDGSGADGPTNNAVFSNYDGLGRLVRVRYDTKRYSGFDFRASAGVNSLNILNEFDAVLRGQAQLDFATTYAGTHSGYQMAGALAFSLPDNGQNRLNGSFSVLHQDTGLNFTVAAATDRSPEVTSQFTYAKLGYIQNLIPLGETRFGVDLYFGRNSQEHGDKSRSLGLVVVQELDGYDAELYFTARSFHYETENVEYNNGHALFTGFRWKF